MARNQMRNLETFKIGNSQVNEFEYQKNRGQMTEQFEHHTEESAKGSKPLTQAERVKQMMLAAHKKVEKRRKKESPKGGKSKPPSSSLKLDAGSKDAAKARAKRKLAAKKTSKKQ